MSDVRDFDSRAQHSGGNEYFHAINGFVAGVDHSRNIYRVCCGASRLTRFVNMSLLLKDEFPGYRFKASMPETDEVNTKPETCNDVFDKFLAYSEHRVSMDDMALSTLKGYREILDRILRPQIGPDTFDSIVYSSVTPLFSRTTQK